MVETEEMPSGWHLSIRDGTELLSRASIYRLQMRIEDAVVTTAGIAGVFTEERARGRGLARRIMERALELMKDQAFSLSFLYGIPAFYDRWGFRTCSAKQEVEVKTHELELHLHRARTPVIVSHRTATQADQDVLIAIYSQDNAYRTGTLVRETSPWKWYRHGSLFGHPPAVKIVERSDGTIDSYAVIDKQRGKNLVVAELACSDWNRFPLLLRLLVAEASRRDHDSIRFLMPMDYPATHYLKQVGIEVKVSYASDGAGMGRIIDFRRAVQELTPLFERRLRESRWNQGPRKFGFHSELGTAICDWDGFNLRTEVVQGDRAETVTVRCSQDLLTAALLGYFPGDQLRLFGAEIVPGEEELLRILLPAGQPFMWPTDWF